ncbi:unnamed protein product [Amaranthus hypochondriacus]
MKRHENILEELNEVRKIKGQMNNTKLDNLKESLQNIEKSGSLESKILLDEIDILKNELKQAMEAEDTSKRAMDELAVALKEIATESNQAKEKLTYTVQHLEAVKEEASILKAMVKRNEENYTSLLKESKKENDHMKNTIIRLRLEAEESLLAFNEKEIQFVNCIKKTEEEKYSAQEECIKLAKSLKEAEEISEKAKDDNKKLRDILKQALNEANAAKEAASLAQTENSFLKDSLIEKDRHIVALVQETERLKRVITSGSKKEIAKLEKENKEKDSKELKRVAKKESVIVENTEKEPKEGRKLSNTFAFDLHHLWPSIHGIGMACKSSKDFDGDIEEEEDVRVDSIFDLVEYQVRDMSSFHHRRNSSAGSSEDNLNLDQFDDDAHYDDLEMDRSSSGKSKALLKRFSDLLRRRNSHSPKDVPNSPKEIPT